MLLSITDDVLVAVISDLHLTSKNNEKVRKLIQFVLSQANFLVLNGDFSDKLFSNCSDWFDTWGDFVRQDRLILVKGNHDCNFSRFGLKLHRYLTLNTQTRTYIITHAGRQSHHSRLIKKIISSLDRVFARFNTTILPLKLVYKLYNARQKQKVVPTLKNKPGKPWVVFGHTHLPEMDESNRYINTGQFKDGRYDVTWIINSEVTQTSFFL